MEEMNKKELELWKMDKISGGAGKKTRVVRCAKCGRRLQSLGNDDEFWCTNDDCDLFHVTVKGSENSHWV